MNGLDQYKLTGRIRLASEIDAALNDPRWQAAERLKKKAKLNLILETDYQEFTPQEQERFVSDMARLLKISPAKLRILRTSPGSTTITLEYENDEDAVRFVSLYINKDPAIQMFGSLRIAGIIPSPLSSNINPLGLPTSSPAPILTQMEIEFVRRQLDEHQRKLLEIQEIRANFVDPRNASPDLEFAEKWHQEEIKRINIKLSALEAET